MVRVSLRGRWISALILAASATLVGCAGPRTSVVLMPDEEGRVGAVSVSNADGAQRIDKAWDTVTVGSSKTAPTPPQPLGQASAEARYASLLKAQPTKPVDFVLFFVLDSTALTEASTALLPAVMAASRARAPTEISVYGHADASGTEQYNLKLSAQRANYVANLLRKDYPTLGQIEVQYFGDRVPLVPTVPHAKEPRNRRVEVVIL